MEHCVVVNRVLRQGLDRIPLFCDLSAFQSKQVDDGIALRTSSPDAVVPDALFASSTDRLTAANSSSALVAVGQVDGNPRRGLAEGSVGPSDHSRTDLSTDFARPTP
jgi:hypothetical protein